MEKITVLSLLNKYRTWVKKGEVQFLPKGSEARQTILTLLDDLIPDFEAASKKEGGLSRSLDWHKTHMKGREFWRELVSSALNCAFRSNRPPIPV